MVSKAEVDDRHCDIHLNLHPGAKFSQASNTWPRAGSPLKNQRSKADADTWAAARIWAGILGKFPETILFLVPQGFRGFRINPQNTF